ncbi:MAG: S-4TM family putative pore-forming effector [Pseudobacter sp.]|uniref:S-4TM family putative pore-forming effector n=1 Tax=Pseudobacter sp. TaxID=2045420 RepID=UPI003F820ED8
MSVAIKQGQPNSLIIQRAFKKQYSIAKRVRNWRIFFTYAITFLFPVISFSIASKYRMEVKVSLGVVSAIWAFCAFWLVHNEKKWIKLGAQLQEKFDTDLFSIPWNNVLVGDKPSPEKIVELSNRYKGSPDTHWYGREIEGISHPYDVLLCQRANVVWDWRLRQLYIYFLITSLVLLFTIQVIYSIHLKLPLTDYLIAILLPSLSAYTLGLREWFEHIDNKNGKKSTENKLNAEINKAIEMRKPIDDGKLRAFQDIIYILRRCPATIPDWFWKVYRKKYNKIMDTVNAEYVERLLQEGSSTSKS